MAVTESELVQVIADRVESWKRWLSQHEHNLKVIEGDYDAGWNSGLKVFLEDEIAYWEQVL